MIDIRQRSRLRLLALAAAVLTFATVTLMFAIAMHGPLPDDVYITWRYARNLAEGHGLVYNIGQHHLGTSGPGYAMLLAGVARVFSSESIPVASEIITALSLFLTSLGLYLAFERSQRIVGFVAGFLFLILPPIRPAYGFEILPQMACMIWAYHLYIRSLETRKPAHATAVLLALGVLMRPDGVLWILPILGHAWWTRQRQGMRSAKAFPWMETGVCLAILTPFILWSWSYYGQPLPVSFSAKAGQKLSPLWSQMDYINGGFKWIYGEIAATDPMVRMVLLLSVAGFALIGYETAKGNKPSALFLSGSTIHALFYAWKLPFYGWYYVPEMLGVAILAGLVFHYLFKQGWRVSPYLGAILAGYCAYQGYRSAVQQRDLTFRTEQAYASTTQLKTYLAFSEWLKQNTEPDDFIGLTEVGIIGWESNRPIVDQFFLVSPGDSDSISRGIWDSAFRKDLPAYIAETPRTDSVSGSRWFQAEYEFLSGFPGDHSQPMTQKERDEMLKRGLHLFRIDVWKRRETPLDPETAAARARSVMESIDAYRKGVK